MLYPVSKIYPVLKKMKWGFINSQGELIVKPIYDLVGPFVEDRCVVEKFNDSNLENSRLQGYINSKGEEIIPLKPSYFCLSFSEGLAQFKIKNEKVGFIDKLGNFQIPPQFEVDYEGEVTLGFSEGIGAVAFEDGWNYINKEGKEIFNRRFEIAKRFKDGYALVSFQEQNYQPEPLVLIDKNAKQLETIDCEIEYFCPGFRNGLCQVLLPKTNKINGFNRGGLNRIGFINTEGNLAFPERFTDVSGFHEDVSIARKWRGNYGVINKKGEWIIEPLYKSIGWFNYGIAPFQKMDKWGKRKWGLLNKQGEIIVEPQFSFIRNFNGFLPSREDPFHNREKPELTTARIYGSQSKHNPHGKEVYINREGKVICPCDLFE